MATYTEANGVKLITTGDEAGTWGSSTNVNLEILDRAANGFVSIALTGTTFTLSLDAQPSSAQNGHFNAIEFTGSPGGTCTVTLQQNDKARVYMILNSTNQAVIITQGSGGNVTIEVGKSSIVLADGAGSGAAVTDFTASVQNVSDLASPFNVGATSVTASGVELNLLDGAAAGTIANSKAVIYGSSGQVNATTLQIAGTDLTATAAELNFVDGVTSAIQTQLNAKQATITGAATTIDDTDLTASRAVVSNASGKVAVSSVTSTEVGYLDGVTSAIQTQLNGKENTVSLTANRAVISDGSGGLSASSVSSTEVGYLDGVTSAVQTQLDGKLGGSNAAATINSLTSSTITLGSWTITTSGSDLKFAYNGTNRFKLSSAGALTVENDVTAFGSA
tara:strand:- start:333 stop:1508 length:1176 start_codon:yes stop_codon:yes gene_type:complete